MRDAAVLVVLDEPLPYWWPPSEAIAWRLGISQTGARDRGELHAVALRLAAQRSDAGRERLAA